MDVCPKCGTPYKSKTAVKCSNPNCRAGRSFGRNFCVNENCIGFVHDLDPDADVCPVCKGPTIKRKILDDQT